MTAGQGGWKLRRLSAAELLAIHREVSAMDPADALERSLVGNAAVLAAVCEEEGRPVFPSGQAVLERLTAPEMEELLKRLEKRQQGAAECAEALQDGAKNGNFDEKRFLQMKEDGRWIT